MTESALRCTPATYARLFEGTPDGQLVRAHLLQLFHKNPYVKGGADAERETIYRAGQLSVSLHIEKMLDQATRGGNDNAEA
jgi:hypothetical protein